MLNQELLPWLQRGRKLRLASASPRRLELLRQVGLEPEVKPVDIDESQLPGENLATFVSRLALTKAQNGVDEKTDLVIGADTIVVLDDKVLCKPVDQDDARKMLTKMAGRHHQVMTGVAVVRSNDGSYLLEIIESRVWIKTLTAAEITAYIATGEPMDKAGSYGIQAIGAFLVERVEGSPSAVAGLPIAQTLKMVCKL